MTTSETWAAGIDPASREAFEMGVQRQAMTAELSVRGDSWERGVRVVRLENDRLAIEIAVDRGMDIPTARIDGIPVGWRSPVPMLAPWFVEPRGFGTQRGFFGGLLTTGGLDHVGPPQATSAERFGYPARESDELPLHGRLSGSPGQLLGYGVLPSDAGPVAWVEGEVVQVALFGEHLRLRRRVSVTWGSTTVRVDDVVANEGYTSSPLALLYHVNAGWPVVQPGSVVTSPGVLVRGDDGAIPVRGIDPESLESTRLFDVRGPETAEASVSARLGDGASIGLAVEWQPDELPSLLEWRVAKGGGHYAVGLEPTTLRPDSAPNVFPELEAGATYSSGVRLHLRHG